MWPKCLERNFYMKKSARYYIHQPFNKTIILGIVYAVMVTIWYTTTIVLSHWYAVRSRRAPYCQPRACIRLYIIHCVCASSRGQWPLLLASSPLDDHVSCQVIAKGNSSFLSFRVSPAKMASTGTKRNGLTPEEKMALLDQFHQMPKTMSQRDSASSQVISRGLPQSCSEWECY